MTNWVRFGFLSVILLNARAAAAEQTFSVGSKASPLTEQGGTARAMAMGSAFVGVAEGSETLLWNPAGLGALCEKELGIHHTSGLGDSFREIGILGVPTHSLGGFAASVDGTTNGSFEGRDALGNQTGNYHAGDMGANLGWGKNIVSRFAVGAAVKTNQQVLAGSTYSTYAADLGLLWNPFSSFKLGATYSNLNIANTYGPYALNSAWHIGASYRPTHPLLLAIASELQPGGVNRLQFGGEYTYSLIAIRAGYQVNFPNADLTGMTGFTLGAGLHLTPHIDLDYAYVPEGDLGADHRISVIYKFGCTEKTEKSVALTMKTEPMSDPEPPPTAVPAAPKIKETVISFQDAHFNFGESTLTPEAQSILDSNIRILKKNPQTFIRISGYTSARGSEAYNQKLSERRADAVRNYLTKAGIPTDRLSIIGYGNSRPMVNEADPRDIHSNAAKANMRTLFEIVVKAK